MLRSKRNSDRTLDREGELQRLEDQPLHRNRFPLVRSVRYERADEFAGEGRIEAKEHIAISINVSSGGMCLLMDWAPPVEEVLRVHVPMPISLAKTPTLAEVRWNHPVPLGQSNLYFVGMKFVV